MKNADLRNVRFPPIADVERRVDVSPMSPKVLTAAIGATLACDCTPTSRSTAAIDVAIPSDDQFYDAMTAPIKRSGDKRMVAWFNCSELWEVKCKPRQHAQAECKYKVGRVSWDRAIFVRDAAGTWRWIGGDRLCPWTGNKTL